MLGVIKGMKKRLLYAILCLHTIFRGIYKAYRTMRRGKTFAIDQHTDQDIVVFGNGPSLAELDLELISKKYKVACVNWFATKNDKFLAVRPSFYFLIDEAFFGGGEEKHFNKQQAVEELLSILQKVDWEMELIIPQGQSLQINNPNITISHITYESINDDRCVDFQYMLYRHNLAVCGMQNVMCSVLHYFILKHYRTIFLSGVDMSEFKGFSIDERNHILVTFEHSYGQENVDLTESGTIPLGGFGNYLGYYSKMFVQVCRLSEFAKIEKVKIINLSPHSFIDVFEKKNWHEIV